MDHVVFYDDDYAERCVSCGESVGLEDLCRDCRRCTDCIAELGHVRTVCVADELEDKNDTH